MESVDRLRQAADELAQRAMPCSNAPDYADVRWKVKQLADAIEREAMEERTAAYNEGYDAGFASADDWAAQHEDAMAEHGWVRLPLDADGVTIHVGDVVRMELLSGGESKPLVVDRMELSRGRDGDLWCVALDTDKGCWNQPSLLHHHHPPTVEDVLREMLDALDIDRCDDPDVSTPSPFTVTKDGSHFEVKVDAHYVSDEEMQTLRRYIANLNDENAKLRELCADLYAEMITYSNAPNYNASVWAPKLRELGVEP